MHLFGVFDNDSLPLDCMFGRTRSTNTTVLSRTHIVCISPTSAAGSVRIALALNDEDYYLTSYYFEYYPQPSLDNISPHIGALAVQGTATVSGLNFLNRASAVCRFGLQIVPALFETQSSVLCRIPPSKVPQEVAVSYSANGVDFVDSSLTFSYKSGPALIAIQPQSGTFYGGTLVQISVISLFQGSFWFCAFGKFAAKATVVSSHEVVCTAPPSADLVDVEVRLVYLTNATSSVVALTQDMSSKLFHADGFASFTYTSPIALVDVSPSVVFLSGGANVSIYFQDYVFSDSLSCIWDMRYTTTAFPLSPKSVTCVFPGVPSAGIVNVSVMANGQLETSSFVKIKAVEQPTLLTGSPLRMLEGQATTIQLFGSNLFDGSINPRCAFFWGQQLVAIVDTVTNAASMTSCTIPDNTRASREIQRVFYVGPSSASETQAIYVKADPNEFEVQRIVTKGWGAQSGLLDLRIASYVNSSARGVYRLTTAVNDTADIKRIAIRSKAYRSEVQELRLNAIVAPMDERYRRVEDQGSFVLGVGAAKSQLYWNLTGFELAAAIKSFSSARHVSVTKETSVNAISATALNISITWTITYGPADGDLPLLSVLSYDVPRAAHLEHESSTVADGLSCDLHSIEIFGANEGYFKLRLGAVLSREISIATTSSTLRRIILSDFPQLADLKVELDDISETSRRWLVYFIGDPGPQSQFRILDVDLRNTFDTMSASDSSFVSLESFVIVRSSVPPLQGTASLNLDALGLSAQFDISDACASINASVSFVDGCNTEEFSSPYSTLLRVRFKHQFGFIENLHVDVASVQGLEPSAMVDTVVAGTGEDTQSISLACGSGFGTDLFFYLGLDDRRLDRISILDSSDTILSYFSSWTHIAVSNVQVSATTKTFGLNVTIGDAESETVTDFYAGSLLCSDGSAATLTVSRLKVGRFVHLGGSFQLSTIDGENSASLPANTSEAALTSAFFDLGYGSVNVSRSVSGRGAYAWLVTFAELKSEGVLPAVSTTALRSAGAVTIAWEVVSAPLLGCCPEPTSFRIRNTCMNLTSSALSSSNSTSTIANEVLATLPDARIGSVVNRPSGGRSFLFEVLDSAASSCVVIDRVNVSSGLNGSFSVDFVSLQDSLKPQVQKILIHASSQLSGNFSLGFLSYRCPDISVDTVPYDLETALESCLRLDSVEVRAVTLQGVVGDYRCWDIYFESTAGNAPLLWCDVAEVSSQYTGDVTCAVTVASNASSTALGGAFSVEVPGFFDVVVPYNASAVDLKRALETALDLPVNVSRLSLEPDGGAQWDITFLANRGSERLIRVSAGNLLGTLSQVSTAQLQRGRFLYGNFSLSFGDMSTLPLQFDAPDRAVKSAIESLSPLLEVSVSSDRSDSGVTYFVRFDSPEGDVESLYLDASNLTGYNLDVKVVEMTKGVKGLAGRFNLQFLDAVSSYLGEESSAADVKAALEAMSSIGEVAVERLVSADTTPEWVVTFTTFGSPTNAGSLPLLQPLNVVSSVSNVTMRVEKVQAGCCDVALTYNDGVEFSSARLGLVVESAPTVADIAPASGTANGLTLVSIFGSGFIVGLNSSSCLFGYVETPATIINDSFATCVSPAHPEGSVVLTLKLISYGSGPADGLLARSSRVFRFVPRPQLLSVSPQYGLAGSQLNITLSYLPIQDAVSLTCMWIVEVNNTVSSVQQFFDIYPCTELNATHCSCPSPTGLDFFKKFRPVSELPGLPASPNIGDTASQSVSGIKSKDRGLERPSAQTWTIAVSPNAQDFSGPLPFNFFPEPGLLTISPEFGFANSPVTISLTGSNFVKSTSSFCRVGSLDFPAVVSSDSSLLCEVSSQLQTTQSSFQIELLYPSVRHEVQIVEYRTAAVTFPNKSIALVLDGQTTAPFPLDASGYGLKNALELLVGVGNLSVVVNKSIENPYRGSASFSLYSYTIRFLNRDDNLGSMSAELLDASAFESGESLRVLTAVDGGCDTALPEIQQWGFAVADAAPEVQTVEIGAAAAEYEVQTVSINSSAAISGFFYLGYGKSNSALISASASAGVFLASLRGVPSIGNIQVSRSRQFAFGYSWMVTFLDFASDSGRPLISVSNHSLQGTDAVFISSSLTIAETQPLSGLISTNFGSRASDFFEFEADASEIERNFRNSFQIPELSLAEVYRNVSFARWVVTFPLSLGRASVLSINATFLKGRSISAIAKEVQPGSPEMSGMYTLSAGDVPFTFYLNASVDEIQRQFVSRLNLGSDEKPIVRQVSSELFNLKWEVQFPVTWGNLSQLILSSTSLGNANTSATVSTVQDGTYSSLAGNFSIRINNITVHNISVESSASSLQTLLRLSTPFPSTAVTKSTYLVKVSGLQFQGVVWEVFFDSNQSSAAPRIRSMALDEIALEGFDSIRVIETSAGQGPDFPVDISFDGQQFTRSGLAFHLIQPIVLLDMFPTSGLLAGGSRVVFTVDPIEYSFFEAQRYSLMCLFNNTKVSAQVTSETSVECFSPPFPSSSGGVAEVTLSSNGQDRAIGSFYFQYLAVQIPLVINPTFGVIDGGTLVNITGSTIKRSSYTRCMFNDIIVTAIESQDGFLLCIAPNVSIPQLASVTFTFNGQDYVSDTGLYYTYVYRPTISRVDPAFGSVTGGTKVKITGQSFTVGASDSTCRFGDSVVSATVSTSKSLTCATPPVKSAYEVQAVDMYVLASQNSVQTIRARTSPLIGEALNISISADLYIPQVQSVVFSVLDVDEVQQVTIGVGNPAPLVARLDVKDFGSQSDIQMLYVSAEETPEIQYVMVRAPYPLPLVNGAQAVQEIRVSGSPQQGFFRVGYAGAFSSNLAWNATALDVQQSLAAVSTIGLVSVTKPSPYTWRVSFTQRLGAVSPLDTVTFLPSGSPISVAVIVSGSTSPIGGSLSLAFGNSTTPPFPVTASASTVQGLLRSIPSLESLSVSRKDLINGGFMLGLTFPSALGNVSPVSLLASSVTGTSVDARVVTTQDGRLLDGTFTIFTFDSTSQRLETPPLPFDCSALELARSIQGLQASFAGVEVSKSAEDSVGTKSWLVVFPESIGEVELLNANGADLEGQKAGAYFIKQQRGQSPLRVKVSTGASSEVSGRFSLSVDGFASEFVSSHATENELKAVLEDLPSVGRVSVSRSSTGSRDFSSWDSTQSVNLGAVDPLFQFDFQTYDWIVTFYSRTGAPPLITACCDELSTLNTSMVTLHSQWSMDSSVAITVVSPSSTERLRGELSLSVGEQSTAFFSMDHASSDDMVQLFEDINIPVSVSRELSDPNGHFSWLITFLNATVPFVDSLLSPSLQVATYNAYPIGSRDRITFSWEFAPSPPSHCVQRIVPTGAAVSCILKHLSGATRAVSFSSYDDQSAIQSSFNSAVSLFGAISLVRDTPGSLEQSWLVLFETYASYMEPIVCSNAAVTLLQNSSLTPLDGDFTVQVLDAGGGVNSTTLQLGASSSDLQSALNGILGPNSVLVSTAVASYGLSSWLVTFIGANVGGDIDLMKVTYTNSTQRYIHVQEVVAGSEPQGTVHLLTSTGTSLEVPVNSSALDLEYAFASVLGSEEVVVTVDGPAVSGQGVRVWRLSYYKSEEDSYFTSLNNSKLLGPGIMATLTDTQVGTVDIGGALLVRLGPSNGCAVAIPVNSDRTQLFASLSTLFSNNETFTVRITSEAAVRTWTILFDFGIPAPSVVVNSSLLIASNPAITVSLVASPSSALGGFFALNYSGIVSSPIPLTASGSDMMVALAALGVGGNISVQKTLSSVSASEWQITFSSLKHQGHTPTLTITSPSLTGDSATIESSLVAGASSSIYQISMMSGLANDSLSFFWDDISLWNVSLSALNSSASIELNSAAKVSFASYEREAINSTVTLLLLVVPSDFSAMNESSRLRCTNASSANVAVSLYQPSTLSLASSSLISFSMGNQGCSVLTSGISCRSDYPIEQSPLLGLLPSESALVQNLETLRNIVQIAVSSYSLSSSYSEKGFIVAGTRYLVTFVKAIQNQTSSEVFNDNRLTWNPLSKLVSFPSSRSLLSLRASPLPISIAPIVVEQVFDVPELIANTSNLTSGWEIDVREVTAGTDARNGGDVLVSVSMNGQSSDYSKQPIIFRYQQTPELRSIVPTHGPVRGGTEIIVYGSNFANSLGLSCRFGLDIAGVVHAAFFFNSSAIVCISPPNRVVGLVDVFVSNNGVFEGGDISATPVNFTFDAAVSIVSAYPTLGTQAGNTSVLIRGGPFVRTDELRCKFGDVSVVAAYLDVGQLQCFTPPYAAGVYPLEVTINDQDYTSRRLPFFFHSALSIATLFPPSGPALSAGTQVLVRGEGFVNTTSLSCKFQNATTTAVFISTREILCIAPPLDGVVRAGNEVVGGGLTWTQEIYPVFYFFPRNLVKLVPLEVSNNNQDFTTSNLLYLYQADAFVTGVYPSQGFIGEENPLVMVGVNFVNSTFLRCRIGAHVTNATFLTKEAVLCFSPRYPLLRSPRIYENKIVSESMHFGPSVVFVEVANNGQDFSDNRLTYEYIWKCEAGYYCPQLNSIPCPPGTLFLLLVICFTVDF